MTKIALVDDNKDQRESYAIRLRQFLKELNSDIEVIDIFPFEKPSDYYNFIDSKNIIAIIVDEKLHNDSQQEKLPVNYNGSDLVIHIRERYKYIPFFTLTNYPEETELQEKINEYDYIFSKKSFTKKQVQIVHRACQRYLEENQKELAAFDDLTKKIASGKAEKSEIEKLTAIQVKLQIPFTQLEERKEWLNEYENQITALKNLISKLENEPQKR